MSYGIRVNTPSGVASFDSSRLGGVLLDVIYLQMSANTTYTFNYQVPENTDVNISINPVSSAYRSDLMTITKTISGTSLSIQVNPGNVSLNAFMVVVLR